MSLPRTTSIPEAAASSVASAASVAAGILTELLRHRRLDPRAATCVDRVEPCCVATRLPAVTSLVRQGAPLRLLLPAFPCKSRSRHKVIGMLPDMAEEQALRHLQRICERLADRYPPGARIVLCTDGLVFSDVLGIPDATVSAYRSGLELMIGRLGLDAIDVLGLDDLVPDVSFGVMRHRLVAAYADDSAALRGRVRHDPDALRLVNGISRFLFEDGRHDGSGRSRTQLRTQARDDAYETVRRSMAWSRVIALRFPDGLRLSVHPQPAHGAKIGVRLAEGSADAWITPWHGVAVRGNGRYRVMHRSEAESLGARLVHRDGVPSHYELM